MDYSIYFRFIQFSLGLYEGREFLDGSALRCFNWEAFYDFARRQTLVGIVFDGIQRLPKAVAPPLGVLMRWLGVYQKIRMRNAMLNEATADIYNKVRNAGYDCTILKGQGNAVMYRNPLARIPGDVDVWVNASRDDIRNLAHMLARDGGRMGKESLNHIELSVGGVAVELHTTPAIMNNPVYSHRLQKWLRQNADSQCGNMVPLPDGAGDVAVPTCAFNAVYQLFHLYHHYFYEGVGLRQIIDYYYVVVKSEELRVKSEEQGVKSEEQGVKSEERGVKSEERGVGSEERRVKSEELRVKSEELRTKSEERRVKSEERRTVSEERRTGSEERGVKNPMALEDELKWLGLWPFAGAVMYVLREVMGLAEGMMIAPVDERRGRMLLDDILNGGNFGHHDRHRAWGHNVLRLYRDAKLVRYYPAEALSEPLFRIGHFLWRIRNRH